MMVREVLDRSLENAEQERYDAVRQMLIEAVQNIRPEGWEKPGRLFVQFTPPRSWWRDVLASGSRDDEIRLWNPASGEHLRTLSGHTGDIRSVAFSPDGSMLASGSDDHEIRLWNPASGEHLRTLSGHTGDIQSVAFSTLLFEEGRSFLNKIRAEMSKAGFSLEIQGGGLTVHWKGYKA